MSKIIQNNTKALKTEDIDNNLDILQILSKYIELYIDNKISANLSKNSIYSIKSILERFYDFVADEFAENELLTIFDINKYFLSNYLNKLSTQNLNKNSQKLHLSIINNFLNDLADTDIQKYGVIRNNINGVKIKVEQKEKDSFTQNEQKLISNYLIRLDAINSFLAQRNALLVKILMYTGIRASELINLKWSDISEYYDENQGLIYTLLIKGKGNKERYTYIAYDIINKNLEYLKENSPHRIYVFSTTQGNICNRSMLYEGISHLLSQAGITKSGLHIFRHTFARTLVDKDVNLSTIKDLLGHSNITITAQFYAKTNENAKRNALSKLKK
ncbi:MAG: tyrosine-type recombinase/integrase [Burkholderiales bacterium]|nr:tyrosine-type recombinase/integrase [Burkholderiales bacterium]